MKKIMLTLLCLFVGFANIAKAESVDPITVFSFRETFDYYWGKVKDWRKRN